MGCVGMSYCFLRLIMAYYVKMLKWVDAFSVIEYISLSQCVFILFYLLIYSFFNSKTSGAGSIWPLLWLIEKCIFWRESETLVFVTFSIVIRHICPEKFTEIPQVVQKLRRIPLSVLAIFINFHQFFGFFYIYL